MITFPATSFFPSVHVKYIQYTNTKTNIQYNKVNVLDKLKVGVYYLVLFFILSCVLSIPFSFDHV